MAKKRAAVAAAASVEPTAAVVEPVAATATAPPAPPLPLRLEWLDPAQLAENPANWRLHPAEQLAALTDVIAEVGWAGVILFNETTGRILDGHARKKVAVEQGCAKVPVLIGRWNEEQEKKILATHDPLAAMAEVDPAKLTALLADIDTESAAVRGMLDMLASENAAEDAGEGQGEGGAVEQDTSPQLSGLVYRVVVDCSGEQQQAELIAKLESEGLKCRPLMS
jgi:hypothetical protein